MRVPKETKQRNNIQIQRVHIDKPFLIPRLPVITNDKQRVSLIKQCEGICRSAIEYADLVSYLRKYADMNECTFLNNFKAGSKRGMIEIHHSPFTLFDIVDIVIRRHEDVYHSIDDFDVCEEVLRLHYSGLVGLIPLSTTCHQLVHDDKLTVPLWCVYGRFVEFTKRYYDWIPDNTLAALMEDVKLSRKFKQNPELLKEANKILDVKFVYLDVEGEQKIDKSLYASMKEMA